MSQNFDSYTKNAYAIKICEAYLTTIVVTFTMVKHVHNINNLLIYAWKF